MPRIAQFPPRRYTRRGYEHIRIKGKEFHLGRSGSPDAEAAYRRIVADMVMHGGNLPEKPDPGRPITVTEAAGQWMAFEGARRTATERKNYRYALQVLARR